MKTHFTFALLAAALTFPVLADHHQQPSKEFSKSFNQMKSLVGTWTGTMDMGQGPEAFEVQYRLVSGGSVIEERTFPGTPKEMVTMYHDKNGKLSLVHYCMLQNQPAMIEKKSSGDTIEFDFDPSCDVNVKKEMHMHSLTLTFNDDGSVTQSWIMYADGKPQDPHPLVLKRKKS